MAPDERALGDSEEEKLSFNRENAPAEPLQLSEGPPSVVVTMWCSCDYKKVLFHFFNCLWSGSQLKHGFHNIWLSPNESLHFFFHTQHHSVISAAAEINLNEKNDSLT